ncbi:MAG: hypothetical protein D6736_18935, partial [Nitrospinota bacterium]
MTDAPILLAQAGSEPRPVSARQLSRMLPRVGDILLGIAGNLTSSLLFSLPLAAMSGSLGLPTIAATMVGAVSDVFLFAAIATKFAALAPPPPEIVEVKQVSNQVYVTVRRTPLDTRQATESGVVFLYTIYRRAAGKNTVVRVVRIPCCKNDSDVFTVVDPLPATGPNLYYADVVLKLPIEIPENLKFLTGTLSIPTRIAIPVGSIISLFFISDLISDYSIPSPYMSRFQRQPTSEDWARARVDFQPIARDDPNAVVFPADIVVDQAQNVYASDRFRQVITKTTPTGETTTFTEPGFSGPQVGLAIDKNGNLYTENSSSEAKFGGRLYQFRQPDGRRSFVGTVNKYSPILDRGNPVSVSAIAVGPPLQGASGGFVPGDLFVAENLEQTIRRIPTSIIPPEGIEALPAPGGGIFGPLAASPVVGAPYANFECANSLEPLRDIAFDINDALYVLSGRQLLRFPYDTESDRAGSPVPIARFGDASPGSISVKIQKSTDHIPKGARFPLVAKSIPCDGAFKWTSSDEEVATIEPEQQGGGFSKVRAVAKEPGVTTVTVTFSADGFTATDSFDLTVVDTSPILFVHGWRGDSSNWDAITQKLTELGLQFGGELCADWVRERGNFLRNAHPFKCDEAREDGAFFTLNFDDNQARFIDLAAELGNIVEQIRTATGAEKVTLVAHSMGGQVSRAFLQNIPP